MIPISIEKVYTWTKNTLETFFPCEVSLFQVTWPGYLVVLGKLHPGTLSYDVFEKELSFEEGFAYPRTGGILSPIIYALSASLESLESSAARPSLERIQQTVQGNLSYWNFPEEIKAEIIDHISHLVAVEFSSKGLEVAATKLYQVFENGEEILCTIAEVNDRYRQRKLRFDIFVDDESGEVLIGKGNKKHRLFGGERDWYLTLTRLLEKVGSYWTHEELFEKGTIELTEHHGSVSQLLYQRLRYVKSKLKEGLNGTEVDNWLKMTTPKRVTISNCFRTCLIKKLK